MTARKTMRLASNNGLLEGVRQIPSPNFDHRPPGVEPELLVIHNISLPPGQFGGEDIMSLFCNVLDASEHPFFSDICDLRVSAHLLIRRDGEVVQFVPLHLRAWHAGVSAFQGRSGCNDFSIGIELEGTDTMAYEDRQYRSLAALIKVLGRRWPLLGTNIVGHSDIAPGRKTDPGASFDWVYLDQLLSNSSA